MSGRCGSAAHGVVVSAAVSIQKSIQREVEEEEAGGVSRAPSGRRAPKRQPVDVEAVMASRRRALYVPADTDTGTGSSKEHISHSERNRGVEVVKNSSEVEEKDVSDFLS